MASTGCTWLTWTVPGPVIREMSSSSKIGLINFGSTDSAVREGQRLGKAALKLAHQDVEALMREDIDEARARLNIGKPVIYRKCLEILESEGNHREDLTLGGAQAA